MPTRPRSTAVLAAGLGLALLVLIWGALPYLPGQIDDAFIVFAYAHNLVERGELVWNTGARVEGYSSPLHLLLMALGALGGLDLSVFARGLSFAAAVATLLLLAGRRFGTGRLAAVVLLAAWQPFQYWSVAGLETSLATLLAVAAWPLVLADRGRWAWGALLLMGLSLARPEGAAWLLAGLLLRLRLGRAVGRPELAVLLGLVFLGGYHAVRVAWFGHLLPTPWLVKIVAVDSFATGLHEVGWGLLSAAPLLLLSVGLRRGVSAWACFPVVLQSVLLVRAGGDWMGHARLLVPGVAATVAAILARGTERDWRVSPAWLAAGAGVLTFLGEPGQMQHAGPRWRDSWFLARPLAALHTPWDVPLLPEVAFLVQRVPAGAGAQLSDVGLPGNLDDIPIWDSAGLTDRGVAEILAGEESTLTEAVRARYDDPQDVWCLRYGVARDGSDPGDAWLTGLFPERSTAPDARGLFWRCRPGGRPDAEVVLARWRLLVERFPVQDGIRWHYARTLVASGRGDEAMRVARQATWVGEDVPGWLLFQPPSERPYIPSRGWPLYAEGEVVSLALAPDAWEELQLRLDVDDPGAEGARVSVAWDPPCEAGDERSIHAPTRLPIPQCSGSGPRRLVVGFLNDAAGDGRDRNLYVTLDSGSSTAEP